MNWNPLHEIQIVHRWMDVDRIEHDHGSFIIIRNCQDCDAEEQTLDLTEVRGPSLTEMTQKERRDELNKLIDRNDEMQKVFDRMTRDLLTDTEYGDVSELLEDIENRYQFQLRGDDLTYRELDWWINTRTRKIKRKVLLAYRQGLVCNKCDSFVFSLNQLTEDHIIPRARGGTSTLLNLQLVCGRCNKDKADDSPSESDISPFAHQGPSCVHRITCVALEELRNRVTGT